MCSECEEEVGGIQQQQNDGSAVGQEEDVLFVILGMAN